MKSPRSTPDRVYALLTGRRSRWVVAWFGWTAAGFLSALHWQIFVPEDPYTWWELLRIKAVLWYMWGGFTLIILWLGTRYRPEGVHLRRNLTLLFGLSVVLVMVYLGLYTLAVLLNLGWPRSGYSLPSMFNFVMVRHSTYYYLAYWTTLGIQYAIHYSARYRERELRESQLRSQLSEARLEALRARLHPHFLFNALNTIASLVERESRDEAYDTLVRLADLLRASLSRDEGTAIPLCRELEFVESYLEIVRARYPDRLRYRVEVEDRAGQLPVPTLILQPLVENAVKHGMARPDDLLVIEVVARTDNGHLTLSVSDNGPGLPEGFRLDDAEGFGLHSTRTRLDDIYGPSGRVRLESRARGGTCVTVTLPSTWPEDPATPHDGN